MEEKKYLNLDMLTMYDALIKSFIGNSIDSKVFIGTYAEYEIANANNLIPLNALVIITDDETETGGTSTWEAPVQNSDELTITQLYSITQQDNVLEVE